MADGCQWAMNVDITPRDKAYTIFQTIDRVTHYKSGRKSDTDREKFTEMWHKPKTGIQKDS